jgi:hypothetical protein
LLAQTEEETIELYDWLALVVEGSDAAEDEVDSFKRRLEEQEQTNAKLYDQLQGLTEAKLQHEDALLHNFGELINSKKLKIRDQQRLLAGATVDPTAGTCLGYIAVGHATKFIYHFPFTAIQVQDSRPSTRARKTEVSTRPSKRKASARGQSESEDDDSESDAFEDVPMKDAEEERATPEKTDRDSDGEEAPPPPPKPRVRRAIGGKATKAAAPASTAASTAKHKKLPHRKSASVEKEQSAEVDDEPPPRRELPFAVSAPRTAATPMADDSETDDEL